VLKLSILSLNFPKFPQNGSFSPKVYIFGLKFSDEKTIFPQPKI